MKIGILTFHNSNNYGAVLQCFALLTHLRKTYEETEIIDYRCANKKDYYKICQVNRQKSLKGNISAVLDIPFHLKKKLVFDEFRNKFYKLSTEVYEDTHKLRANTPWDAVIVGSDQVWNDKNTKGDTTYLLDFIDEPRRKIAYAASFGKNELSKEVKACYQPLLNGIGSISVRENTGIHLVNDIVKNQVAIQVVDPTFLLKKQEWQQYESPLKIKKDYVLLYTIENSKEIISFAGEVAERSGCQLIRVANRSLDFIEVGKQVIPSPSQFIYLIHHAKYVVTDSYHGTILSINMNKPFYVFPQQSSQSNERMRDILAQLQLTKRIIERGQKLKELKPISYKKINRQLEQYRMQSISFLKESLEKAQLMEEGKVANEN